MAIDPISLIFLALTAAILAIILLIVVVAYVQSLQKLHKIEETNAHLQNQLNENPIKLSQEAHSKALQIIDQANKEATAILSHTKEYQEHSESSLKDALTSVENLQKEAFQKASQELQTAYSSSLTEAKNEGIKLLGSLTKDIESDAVAEFKDFTAALEKETINAEKIAKQKIDEEYLDLKKELEAYKEERMQKLNEDIYKILYKVSELILSQGISFDRHKQLVIEALEEAKKEQIFQ
jgi:hypothetical protein